MFEDTFERIRQLFQLAIVIAQQLPVDILGSTERTQELIDNPGEWGPRLRQTFVPSTVQARAPQSAALAPQSSPKYVVVRDEKTGYDTITVKVKVKRALVGRPMLAATGRTVYASDASITTMPLIGGAPEGGAAAL